MCARERNGKHLTGNVYLVVHLVQAQSRVESVYSVRVVTNLMVLLQKIKSGTVENRNLGQQLHSSCRQESRIQSYSHKWVSIVEPESKYTVQFKRKDFLIGNKSTLNSVHTLTFKHKHHNGRYAPQTQHITSHHSINNRLFRVNVPGN